MPVPYGAGPELASQYIGMKGEDYATKESFEDEFHEIFKDEEDFGIELIRECYDIDKMMGDLAPYFDYAAFARDLFLNGDDSGIELHLLFQAPEILQLNCLHSQLRPVVHLNQRCVNFDCTLQRVMVL